MAGAGTERHAGSRGILRLMTGAAGPRWPGTAPDPETRRRWLSCPRSGTRTTQRAAPGGGRGGGSCERGQSPATDVRLTGRQGRPSSPSSPSVSGTTGSAGTNCAMCRAYEHSRCALWTNGHGIHLFILRTDCAYVTRIHVCSVHRAVRLLRLAAAVLCCTPAGRRADPPTAPARSRPGPTQGRRSE